MAFDGAVTIGTGDVGTVGPPGGVLGTAGGGTLDSGVLGTGTLNTGVLGVDGGGTLDRGVLGVAGGGTLDNGVLGVEGGSTRDTGVLGVEGGRTLCNGVSGVRKAAERRTESPRASRPGVVGTACAIVDGLRKSPPPVAPRGAGHVAGRLPRRTGPRVVGMPRHVPVATHMAANGLRNDDQRRPLG